MTHAEEAAASPAQPSPAPTATPADDPDEIVLPSKSCKVLEALAKLLEEAIKVCAVSTIKEDLIERARGAPHRVLRLRDINESKDFLVAYKHANCTRSTSKPVTQLQDEHEIGATDDDDEATADEHPPRGGLEHILVAINSQKLSDAAREHEATADSIVAVTHNGNTITPAESHSPEEAPATPSQMPNPPTNKRDRSISVTSVNPSNKRVCYQTVQPLQPLQPVAPPPLMMIDQRNYDDRPEMVQATDIFHHHLEMHVQDLRQQHEHLRGNVELHQHHINHELEIHQPYLEAYRAAQEYSLQAEAKVENIRKNSETLNNCLKNLADSQKLCLPSVAENFEAVEQHMVAQLAVKAKDLEEAEAELGAAHLACHQTEEAARPALEFMNTEKPQLEEKKTATEKLGKTVEHTGFLQLLVRTSPSAIAILEKFAQDKGSSLEELRAEIDERRLLTQMNGQQADVPMD
ncbi:hypothetical protein FPCIR_339 [Fusarium pseudocircinatum]|uniref:Uncharacterized protein n=1 Tax=Fusarium pseudocircinatum TaxID=56676 RepID=A0A8H5Q063_9HYPO|nr:hypothetical protein FPCIR_339 [Fusarium pseudocircinatum]